MFFLAFFNARIQESFFLGVHGREKMSIKLVVIGAGPAGYPAALTAAKLGAEVTVIEKAHAGGVCLHSGCIPSKSLLDAAHRFDVIKNISSLCDEPASASAQTLLQQISWPKIQSRQQAVTQKLTLGITGLFRQAKVNVVSGIASFKDKNTLLVKTGQEELEIPFDYAIVCSGSTAFVPPPFDKIREHIYDNSNIFTLPKLPKTLTIVGGGVIGCEFATLMSSLGVKVSVIEMQPRLLPTLDESLSRVIQPNLQKRGVTLLLGKKAVDARVENNQKILTLDDGSEVMSDEVLAAIGRSCDLSELKAENAGLSWDRKGLKNVNPHTLQVTENIYAAGDVTGLSLLAHAATRQGITAASNICGKTSVYHNELVPNAVYTSPELASVGLSKQQALTQGIETKTYKYFMLANGRALTMDAAEGFVEIVADKNSDKILGAVMAAPNASEIISTVTVALEADLTVEQLKKVIFPHPTVCESIGDALAK